MQATQAALHEVEIALGNVSYSPETSSNESLLMPSSDNEDPIEARESGNGANNNEEDSTDGPSEGDSVVIPFAKEGGKRNRK